MSYELRLKQLRMERGMSQRGLAQAVNVSAAAICQWETGATQPSTENLVALASALQCSLDDLVRPKATAIAPA